jgi:hypothetical protein
MKKSPSTEDLTATKMVEAFEAGDSIAAIGLAFDFERNFVEQLIRRVLVSRRRRK